MGGGGFQMESVPSLLDAFLVGLVRQRSGRERPRICLIPTAAADEPTLIASFEERFGGEAETSVLRLFARAHDDPEPFLQGQDAVYVAGGNTANLLTLWRLHGIDRILRAAWRRGLVLAGMSAGAICWFESCTTDSFGPTLQPLHGGLGILDGSLCPHYHGEPQRRPLYLGLVGDGTLPAGYAVDDGAALVFRDRRLEEVVTASDAAGAWWVEADGAGGAVERALPARRLRG
jgi:dipeptidase E